MMRKIKSVILGFYLLHLAYFSFAQELKNVVITSEKGEKLIVSEGHIILPENRKEANKNTVKLTYQILKSKTKTSNQAVFLLAGGPGGSWLNTTHLEERFAEIKFYSQYADVVIFDQRGTGRSIPNLNCKKLIKGKKCKILSEDYVTNTIRELATECRDYWISKGIDLKAYNTDESANDIDDLRKKLEYEKIILIGGSYGSHLGLHYLKKFEKQVKCAIFHGLEGPNHTLDKPSDVLKTLTRIFEKTEQSEFYSKKLSGKNLLDIYKDIAQKIKDKKIKDLDLFTAQFILKYRAGKRNDLSVLPDNLLALQRGDYSFAKKVKKHLAEFDAPHAMSNVMDLASWCSPNRLKEIKQDSATTIIGNINLSYFAKKDIWEIYPLGEDFRKNVISNVPVLLIHGTWDMSTPIENAYEVSKHLSNSHLLKVEHGSHGVYYELFKEWKPIYKIVGNFMQGKVDDIPESITLALEFPQVYNQLQTDFWDAIITGDLEKTKQAFREGAKLDILDTRSKKSGRTAMHWAAWYNQKEILKFLLQNGGNINIQNKTGYTPIHHAVENCSIESLKFLLKKGADISIPSLKGTLPLETAKTDCQKAVSILEK